MLYMFHNQCILLKYNRRRDGRTIVLLSVKTINFGWVRVLISCQRNFAASFIEIIMCNCFLCAIRGAFEGDLGVAVASYKIVEARNTEKSFSSILPTAWSLKLCQIVTLSW